MMKKNISRISLLLVATLVVFSSCKKHGCTNQNALNYSSEADKDDGSCILASQSIFEEQFTLEFGQSSSYGIYEPTFNYEPGDAIILENLTYTNPNYWSPLPIVTSGAVLWGEYGYDFGDIWIYTEEVDTGNDFPWPSNVTFSFRAFLIKKSALELNPGLEDMTIDEIKAIL